MAINARPIQFRDYLPEVYRDGDGVQLVVQSVSVNSITVKPFNSGSLGFRAGTPVAAPRTGGRSRLAQAIPSNSSQLTQINVQDATFGTALKPGDTINVFNFQRAFLQEFEALFEQLQAAVEGTPDLSTGGAPDLFSPALTPPSQFANRPNAGAGDFEFLSYLASWLALPLRPEKPLAWNREFFQTALALYAQRSTLPGIDGMLRAWLKGELWNDPDLIAITDLGPAHTDATAVFQLGVAATLGVNTVLGEGPPFLFVADLLADPQSSELRTPAGLDVMQRAARYILDSEKPAHTYYQLRLRANTMQLAPTGATTIDGRPVAQIGATTLLWQEPWVYDSD